LMTDYSATKFAQGIKRAPAIIKKASITIFNDAQFMHQFLKKVGDS